MLRTEILVAGCVALALLVGACSTTHRPGSIEWKPYDFVSKSGERIEAQLGRMMVPARHDTKGHRSLEIAFVKLPTTSKSPGSPIVYLAGGPGGSGINLAKGARFPLFQALRSLGDVIALDQRGAGLSQPNLACPEDLEIPSDAHRTYESTLRSFQESATGCAGYWRDHGVDLGAFTTNENADDVELLRQALGARKLRIVGMSYGSHLGLVLLRRHGSRIERAVLAGVEGPDHSLKSPAVVQMHLERVSDLIASSSAGSQLPDFLQTLDTTIKELDRAPVLVDPAAPFSRPIRLSAFDVKVLTSLLLSRRQGIGMIPQLFAPIHKDREYAPLAALIPRYLQQFGMSAMGEAMDCASGASPERLRRIEQEATSGLLSEVIGFPFPGVCAAWQVADLGPEFRADVRSDVPTLFVSGDWDINTPVQNAVEVRRGFPTSSHLIVGRVGHEDALLVGSTEILGTIVEFLAGSGSFDERRVDLPPLTFQ